MDLESIFFPPSAIAASSQMPADEQNQLIADRVLIAALKVTSTCGRTWFIHVSFQQSDLTHRHAAAFQPLTQPAHTCRIVLLSAKHPGCHGKDWQFSVCLPLGRCATV